MIEMKKFILYPIFYSLFMTCIFSFQNYSIEFIKNKIILFLKPIIATAYISTISILIAFICAVFFRTYLNSDFSIFSLIRKTISFIISAFIAIPFLILSYVFGFPLLIFSTIIWLYSLILSAIINIYLFIVSFIAYGCILAIFLFGAFYFMSLKSFTFLSLFLIITFPICILFYKSKTIRVTFN